MRSRPRYNADPCAAAPAECAEPHPSAVCALPAQRPDDDEALAAADHFQQMQQLSANIGRFVFACADILSTGQCAAWRAQIPTLDTICGLSCAPLRTVSGAVKCSNLLRIHEPARL